MNELRLNELLNKIYYEYLDGHEAEEFIIYFKRLKQDKDNLQSKIDKAIEYIKNNTWEDEYGGDIIEDYNHKLLDILKDAK